MNSILIVRGLVSDCFTFQGKIIFNFSPSLIWGAHKNHCLPCSVTVYNSSEADKKICMECSTIFFNSYGLFFPDLVVEIKH